MTSSANAIFNNPSPVQQVKSEKTEYQVSFCSPSSESLFVKSENDSESCSSHSPKNISRDAFSLTPLNEQEVCVKEEIVEIDEVNSGVPVKSYELSIPGEVTNDNKALIIKTLESKTGVQNISHLVLMTDRDNGPSDSSKACEDGNELGDFSKIRDYSARTTEKCSTFFTCGKCEYETISRHILNQHYKKDHILELYSCEHCNRLYQHEQTLKEHIRRFHSSRVFSCSKCNFSSSRYKTLRRHRILQHNRYFSCEDCDYKTKIKKLLVVHTFNKHQIQTKTTLNILLCNICNKVFHGFAKFDLHQRIHTGEYCICPHCRMKFIDQKSLDDHYITVHMIHKCSICSFRSSRKKDLLGHKKCVHRNNLNKEELYPFQCKTCLKRFTTNCSLAGHKKLRCKNVINCPHCRMKFIDQKSLDDHITVHMIHQCSMCSFRSSRKKDLLDHKKCVQLHRTNLNDESGKSGKFRRVKSEVRGKIDENVKNAKKVYVCHACNEQFPALKVLKRHLKYCVF